MSVLKRYTGSEWEAVGGAEAPPIRLGYTANTSLSQTTTGTQVDITGLSVTVTVAAGRTIKITGHVGSFANTATACQVAVYVQESTTILGRAGQSLLPSTQEGHLIDGSVVVVSPSAGSHTYKLTVSRATGSGTVALEGSATHPAYILVEDITGGSGVLSGADVWAPWTPTLTNLTLGNGTVTAAYVQDGRIVHWRFKFVLGSTSAVGTTPGISLPVAAHADYVAQFPIGMVRYFDTSAGLGFSGYMRIEPPNEARFLRHGGASSQDIGIAATTPMTWATGDGFYAFGSYEAA